jgi:hypothetical protein
MRAAILVVVLAAGAWGADVGPCDAGQRRALPALNFSAAEGLSAATDGLPSEGRWLLVYVQPGCRPCEAVLSLVKGEEAPEVVQRMVVIVGGLAAGALDGFRARYPDLAGATWQADPDRSAARALRLSGIPVVLGVDERTIAWTLSGAIDETAKAKLILSDWIEDGSRRPSTANRPGGGSPQ